VTALWVALIIAAVGSYLLKLAGMSLPESILNHPKVQRVAQFLPIAMLSALVAVELSDGGGHYMVDWRSAAAARLPCRVRGRNCRDRAATTACVNGAGVAEDAVHPHRDQGRTPAAPG
jgi:branched-subunit amino acid transport protein